MGFLDEWGTLPLILTDEIQLAVVFKVQICRAYSWFSHMRKQRGSVYRVIVRGRLSSVWRVEAHGVHGLLLIET